MLDKKVINDKYYKLMVHESEDAELDEKIEQELKRKGIFVGLDKQN